MAIQVFTNAFVEVNGVNLSDHVQSVTLNLSAEMVDATAMGTSNRARRSGLTDYSLDINFQQDFAAAKVDATIWPLVGSTTCWQLRPTNTCSTAINPSYSGIGIIETYPPLGGAVGALLMTAVRIQAASSISRASSS